MDGNRRWIRVVAAVTLVVAGTVAVVLTRDAESGVTVRTDGAADSTRGRPAPTPVSPGAPDDGKASRGLPITALPATDLTDAQHVEVRGSSFTPGIRVGVVMCVQRARNGGGVSHCDTSGVVYADVIGDGTFQATLEVRRIIETPADGEVDCGAAEAVCVIAAGNLADYDESGAIDITFTPGPPPPPPTLTVDESASPLADGDVVAVRGRGYHVAQLVAVMQCPRPDATNRGGAGCMPVAEVTPEASGTFTIDVKVWRWLPDTAIEGDSSDEVDCAATACVLQTFRSGGLRSAATSLTFDPDDDTRAPAPVVRVTPTTGLRDGDTITVIGSGFPPSLPVSVAICAREPGGCSAATDAVVTRDRAGTIQATVRAQSTFTNDHDPAKIDCRRTECHLAIFTMAPLREPPTFPLKFAP